MSYDPKIRYVLVYGNDFDEVGQGIGSGTKLRCDSAIRHSHDLVAKGILPTLVVSAGMGSGLRGSQTFARQMVTHMFPMRPSFTIFLCNDHEVAVWGLYAEMKWLSERIAETGQPSVDVDVVINPRSWPRVRRIGRSFPNLVLQHVPSSEPPASYLHEFLGHLKLLVVEVPIIGSSIDWLRRIGYKGGY